MFRYVYAFCACAVSYNALVYSSKSFAGLAWHIFSASGWFICGLETLLLGGLCATVAYLIGQFVDGLIAKS